MLVALSKILLKTMCGLYILILVRELYDTVSVQHINQLWNSPLRTTGRARQDSHRERLVWFGSGVKMKASHVACKANLIKKMYKCS